MKFHREPRPEVRKKRSVSNSPLHTAWIVMCELGELIKTLASTHSKVSRPVQEIRLPPHLRLVTAVHDLAAQTCDVTRRDIHAQQLDELHVVDLSPLEVLAPGYQARRKHRYITISVKNHVLKKSKCYLMAIGIFLTTLSSYLCYTLMTSKSQNYYVIFCKCPQNGFSS